jgi:hypothetical protein
MNIPAFQHHYAAVKEVRLHFADRGGEIANVMNAIVHIHKAFTSFWMPTTA